ncbi:MAG: formate dehydrogenase accessory protein FdhE [Syntrophomonadaceae bacterium]|jgi:FdhE protein|nr:formate dehydrogenase accessory protein FdhE [Syntrophomonadaceae bacterium]
MPSNIPVQLPNGYLEFFSSLESWQNEQQIKLQANMQLAQVVEEPLRKIAKHRRPLITITGLEIDPERYRQLLADLLVFLIEQRPDIAASLEAIQQQLSSFDYALLITRLIEQDMKYLQELARSLKISPQLFIFVLDHAIRPFLRIYAAQYQADIFEYTYQNWDLPTICPICGSKSHFSRLRAEDGRRFMFCDRCFTEWETRYLECVHCGNDEPGKINYISVENDASNQLYICEKCRGYLKTYDERPSGMPTDLFLANIQTIYLDLLAEEKGYSNHNDDWIAQ